MNEREKAICEKLLDGIESAELPVRMRAIEEYKLFFEAVALRKVIDRYDLTSGEQRDEPAG